MMDFSKLNGMIEKKDVRILHFESVDSTNNEAKRLLSCGLLNRLVLIANRQTDGRGRNGKNFFSPADTGLYMSLVIHPDAFPWDAVSITTIASVAVARAIEEVTDIHTGIKWVNDIFLSGKKVGGILTEAVSDFRTGTVRSVIIGIGINLTTQKFPHGLSEIAGSLEIPKGSIEKLAAAIVNNVFNMTDNLADKSYIDEYRRRSIVIGKEIDYFINGVEFTGLAMGIDESGRLIVQKPDGETDVLDSGEISIRVR